MLLKIFRWFYGYTNFSATGNNIEKFINTTVRNGINLWDVKKNKDKLFGSCISSECKYMLGAAKKTNTEINIVERRGLPIYLAKYKKRLGFVVGILLFISIIYSMSFYVWEVNVEGNETISIEEVKAAVEELGVSPGCLKSRVDVPIVQQSAMLKLPNVSWLSLNIEGSKAVVSLKERVIAPEIVPKGNPCNIKASVDGQIERTETYKGTIAVNDGDGVVRGQLLISGVVEDGNGNNSFVHAEGKIYAHTKRTLVEEVPLSRVTSADTGKIKKRHKIKILGIEVPLTVWNNIDENYRVESFKNVLKIGNIELPIIVYTDKCYEQICDEKSITYEDALCEARKKIQEREENEFNDKQILNKNEKTEENSDKCRLEVEYDCVEDIGQEEEIIFE